MIQWQKYDPFSRDIESHVNHLITDGRNIWVAYHEKRIYAPGYTWFDDEREPMGVPVTHFAFINLPREEET
jgi:hypothetical protein